MDTFSHAAWGYAALRWRGSKAGRIGALLGAAPDLLFFIPLQIETFVKDGRPSMLVPRDPGIWRSDGPPLPPDLARAYHDYYVYTHSLVVLAAVLGLLLVIKKRHWLWFAIPYAFHIMLDLFTHERYLTPIFFPLSDWTFSGLAWSDLRIYVPNLIALALVYTWIWRRYRPRGERPPEI